MKRLLFILVFCSSLSEMNAQFSDSNAIYITSDINLINYTGFDINLNYVYKEKYSFKVGYNGNFRVPKSKPDDYPRSLFSFGYNGPYDQIENYQIGIGRIYKLNESGTFRVNMYIGVGYTTIREPENWELHTWGTMSSFFTHSEYTYDINEYRTLSLIINPKIEYSFYRFFGITVSPFVQINKDQVYYGIGFGQMLGLLRKARD